MGMEKEFTNQQLVAVAKEDIYLSDRDKEQLIKSIKKGKPVIIFVSSEKEAQIAKRSISPYEVEMVFEKALKNSAVKCPVCEGSGNVQAKQFVPITKMAKTCHGCSGRGWVVV